MMLSSVKSQVICIPHDEKSSVPIKGTGDKDADCKMSVSRLYMCSVIWGRGRKEIPWESTIMMNQVAVRHVGMKLHTKR